MSDKHGECTLQALVASEGEISGSRSELLIQELTADSREVQPGSLFAALPGTNVDGATFIPGALKQGASAILTTMEAVVPADCLVPVVRSGDPRRLLARMAARFYGQQPATIVAVTGTSGKSSVVDFTRQIFTTLGRQAASLGTIGIVRPDGSAYGGLTTPDPVRLHNDLSELATEGVTHLAVEASSHGLEQRRLDGVVLHAAAFTNLGHDHLDYHGNMDDYLAAKLRLFDTLLEPGRTAVINVDDPAGEKVRSVAQARGLQIFSVGQNGDSLKLLALERDGFSQNLTVQSGGRSISTTLPLLGAYQASNALVAAGLTIASGEDAEQVLAAFENLKGVTGRLEVVGKAHGGIVIVDYAHKPDALAAVLTALRPFASGRLVCVFGCGGDRDRDKRAVMGRIATAKADITIVTDDNPRGELPGDIRRQIMTGAPGAQEIADRGEAINEAVSGIGAGDVIVIAGKGHETGQIVGDRIVPFSDHLVARQALEALATHD